MFASNETIISKDDGILIRAGRHAGTYKNICYLIENTETTIAFNGNEPIEVRIPAHMNLKVAQTDPGFRGDTAQGGTKPATLETGVIIQVPLFIEKEQVVRVDTREKKY